MKKSDKVGKLLQESAELTNINRMLKMQIEKNEKRLLEIDRLLDEKEEDELVRYANSRSVMRRTAIQKGEK